MSALEWIAVAFGIGSVFLSTRQNILSWPTAIMNVVLYIAVFYGAKLYADMGLQVVYAVLNAYGWYAWLYGGADRSQLRVSRTSLQTWAVLVVIAMASAVILGVTMKRYTDAALPYMDASLTATSLVAQWMMTRKKIENWIVWVAVDLVYIPMYIYKHLYLTAGLYAVWMALSAVGYKQWRQTLQSQAAV